MNVLLVEPNSTIGYPNLALMKLAAKHSKDNVKYQKGEYKPDLFEAGSFEPDKIYISTLFTYYADKAIQCINYYTESYPDADIQVGGIFATLMPDYIEKETGIKPFVGYDKKLDMTLPNYDIVEDFIKFSPKIEKWKKYSILFTTRGCPRRCAFCAVNKLEPGFWIVPNWKDLVIPEKKYVMMQDNNLTSAPMDHFEEVMKFLIDKNLRTCFNNGFDVRVMTDDHIKLLSQVKWSDGGLRVAFDHMGEDGHIQKCASKLLELGVPKYAFTVFCMFNFKDDLDEAMYRMSEIRKLGIRPYPIPYKPLDMLNSDMYVADKWTAELIREFRFYWLMAGNYKKKTFEEHLKERKKKLSDLMPK